MILIQKYHKFFLLFFLIFSNSLFAQINRFDESTCHLIHRGDHDNLTDHRHDARFRPLIKSDNQIKNPMFTANNEENIVTSFLKAYGNDVWKFTKVDNEDIKIEFTGVQVGIYYGAFGEVHISVIKPDGTYMIEFSKIYSTNSSAIPKSYVIPGDSPNGEYQIEVSPYKNEKGGYKLGAIKNNSYINLTSYDAPRPVTQTYKINDSANSSEEWNYTENGSFSQGDDVHSYSVVLKKDENLVIDLYNIEPYLRGWWGGEDWSSMDTKLYLLDSEGNIVAQDDDSGNNKNARIYYTVEKSGTYNLIATNYGKYDENQWSTDVSVQHPDWKLGSTGITYYTLEFDSDSSVDFVFEEYSVNDTNSVMINAVLITNDESLNEIPITVSKVQDLIKELNKEYNVLYDSGNWSSFELAGVTKFYNEDYHVTGAPHQALAQIGNGPAVKKNYLNLIFLDCDADKTGIVGTTYLYSSVLDKKGASIVLDKDAGAGVLIHEMGHVIGMNHTAGTWPPASHTIDLQDNKKLGYLTADISKAENSYMSNWTAYPLNYDPYVSIYLTDPKYTLATPSYGDHFKEGFRSWLVNNDYISSDAPGTGYEGNNILDVSSNFKNFKEFNTSSHQLFPSIASSKNSENNKAVFSFVNSNNNKLSYATRDKDNEWSNISEYSGDIYAANVKMNSRGDAVIIAEPFRDQGIISIYKPYNSDNWDSPVTISSSDFRYHLRSSSAMNSSGDVAVVWLENHDFDFKIISNELVGGVWKGEEVISSSSNNKELPSVAYNDSGDMIITWQEWNIDDSERYDVVGKFREGYNGSWGVLETYNDKSNHAGFSQVALDDSGDAIIYWREEVGTFEPNATDNPTGELMVRYRDEDGTFEDAQSISPDGEDSFNASLEVTKPRIVFQNGKAAVTWWGVNDGRNVIYASIMKTRNSWTNNRLTDSGKSAINPSISIGNSSDSLIGVSWQRTDGLHYRIQSRFYNLNTNSWSSTYTASDAGGNAIHSDISIDSDDKASISWVRYSSGSGKYVPQIRQFIPLGYDSDGDGLADESDNCPLTANADQLDTDGDGEGDVCDTDDDGDGVLDTEDNCPLTANADQLDTDDDGDGDVCDTDDDGDGVLDTEDNCPLTANEDQLDTDGDGEGDVCDNDDDGDGVIDTEDNCLLTANKDQLDTDGDGKGDVCDTDDDGDGVLDTVDNCPLTANADQLDTDGDGEGDVCDEDDDNDSYYDFNDNCPLTSNIDQLDTDGDGTGNVCDTDDDGDGVLDTEDNCPLTANADQLDTDGDGEGDVCDTDDDGDGVLDTEDNCPLTGNADQLDTDGDGEGDFCDTDDDGDGILDTEDNCPLISNIDQLDTDGDGEGDVCDTDDDGDGVLDTEDNCPLTANADQLDTDGDGEGDVCDTDDDGDGVVDSDDNCPLTSNADQEDWNNNGIGDVCGDPKPLNNEYLNYIENIYPNPTDDKLIINIKPNLEIKDLFFIDFSSKLIKPKSIDRNKNQLDINVSNLSVGIYILKIITSKENINTKIIIER